MSRARTALLAMAGAVAVLLVLGVAAAAGFDAVREAENYSKVLERPVDLPDALLRGAAPH